MRYMEEKEISRLNFRYVGTDGGLKTVNFAISGKEHLVRLFNQGERIDGSRIFGRMDKTIGDIYLIPRPGTAFLNPFSETAAIDVLCSLYLPDGNLVPFAPDTILRRAHAEFKKETGLTLEAMPSLEYYVVNDSNALSRMYSQSDESPQFAQWEDMRALAMLYMEQAGAKVKCGHCGNCVVRQNDREMIQSEIEFLSVPVEEAADQLVIAKWVLNMLGYEYAARVSFAPMLEADQTGGGLLVSSRVLKDGLEVMRDGGKLSDYALKMIGGYLKFAPSLAAFGNTLPTSYLRLAKGTSLPLSVTWSENDRAGLLRIPSAWEPVKGSEFLAEKTARTEAAQEHGVEYRAADGSANVHLFIAAMTVAAKAGLTEADSLETTEKMRMENIAAEKSKDPRVPVPFPKSCQEASERLVNQREVYERGGVFPPALITGIAEKLASYGDKQLSEKDVIKIMDGYLD
jgi:glutamine synthetase